MNRVFLIGNTTDKIELKATKSGKSFCKFTLAVKRDADTTDFIDCEAWKMTAENISKYVGKGDKLAVSGALQVNSYEDHNGQKRRAWSVVVFEFEFMQRRERTEKAEEYKQVSPVPAVDPNNDPAAEIFADEELPF